MPSILTPPLFLEFCRSFVSSKLLCLPSSISLSASCPLSCLCDFLSLVVGCEATSCVSCVPYEGDLSGEYPCGMTLLFLTIYAQVPPSVVDPSIAFSILSSLGDKGGTLVISWASSSYTSTVTISKGGISPSSITNASYWLLIGIFPTSMAFSLLLFCCVSPVSGGFFLPLFGCCHPSS